MKFVACLLVLALAATANAQPRQAGHMATGHMNATAWKVHATLTPIAGMPMTHDHGSCSVVQNGTHMVASLHVKDTMEVTIAHIHYSTNGTGSNGPSIVWLIGRATPAIAVSMKDAMTTVRFNGSDLVATSPTVFPGTADEAMAKFISGAESGLLYCNVHTVKMPSGETRGTLGVHKPAAPTKAPSPKKSPPKKSTGGKGGKKHHRMSFF